MPLSLAASRLSGVVARVNRVVVTAGIGATRAAVVGIRGLGETTAQG